MGIAELVFLWVQWRHESTVGEGMRPERVGGVRTELQEV